MMGLESEIDKSVLRARLAAERDALNEELRVVWSERCSQHLVNYVQECGFNRILAYVPFRSELNISPFVEWCWSSDVEVWVPRCRRQDRSMTFYRLRDWDNLVDGAYGIKEPDPETMETLSEAVLPDLVIVPGLGFDYHGGRIGYGGGYYDRYAAAASNDWKSKPVSWIGVGYESQIMEKVPTEAHDLRLGGIATETGVRTSIEA
ncbi:5-formyltetrahydrofolate cyclo-ligase [Paenibacillus chungangensis]|uniref:5-formyltetrahydrofolate cyclo-ligase n=1 Tax=Paenibacillus chungangensis TaxID=696535 RepID=A0ABW3HTQ5_9BACL